VTERVVFVIAALTALSAGALVVTLRSPFRAAVSLIVALFAVAVIFLLAAAPFVAAIQVIVYAGAIVVLFLFVIAYLGDRGAVDAPDRLIRLRVLGALAVVALLVQGGIALASTDLPGLTDSPREIGDIGSPEAIGRAFIDRFIVPFEATSLLLLVAAVGAVLLAKKAVRLEGGR
jgi:NADH-quinone oxidoreductase subunit J